MKSNNTFPNVFSLAFEPSVSSSPELYNKISTDPDNPSGLFHIKMKAQASGSGEMFFPHERINSVHDQFFTYSNLQYEGPMDFSAASEPVNIQGPVSGDP
ncbi:MAG: hypothetical protein U5N56_11705 [Candidatus Marinimicrobia bacterium]|nr:hypothetical protein [Candidatus Neomarinimicrobiota bacterium]